MSTIQLTPEQHAVVGQSGIGVARAVDSINNKTYVLVEEPGPARTFRGTWKFGMTFASGCDAVHSPPSGCGLDGSRMTSDGRQNSDGAG